MRSGRFSLGLLHIDGGKKQCEGIVLTLERVDPDAAF